MLWKSLCSWWNHRSRPRLAHLQIVVFTRQGCHLCDDAWRLLEELRRERGYALSAVDVDTDPQLVAEYGEQVPVVTVNGRVRFRGRVNRVLLERLLYACSFSGEP
jgi:glutaredoxin